MPLLRKTRNPCFFPCDFAPSPLYQDRAWDYFPPVLNFSVCLKCKSVSRVFCGVLWPPIFSTKRFATILWYQWQEHLPLWVVPPALGIVCAQRGWEASDNLPQRKIISWLMSSHRSDSSIGHEADFSTMIFTSSLTAEAQGAPGCLCLLWFVLFCCFIPFYSQCWHRRGGERSEIEQTGEDMNLNRGEHWKVDLIDSQGTNPAGTHGEAQAQTGSSWLEESRSECSQLHAFSVWHIEGTGGFAGVGREKIGHREMEVLVFKIEQLTGKFQITFLLKDPVAPYEWL